MNNKLIVTLLILILLSTIFTPFLLKRISGNNFSNCMKEFLPEITNKYEEAEKEACLEPSMTCIQLKINHMWEESQLETICNDMR